MAGVMIDIPGIGNVEAKNAATEATLREILKVMQGVQKNTAGGSSSAGGGAASAASSAGGGGAGGAGGSTFTKAAGAAGKAIGGVGKAAGLVAGGLGKVTAGAGFVAGKLVGLAESGLATADSLSKLDGSAGDAASMFSSIPILGPIFKMVGDAADKMRESYQSATAAGASFGGSISQFSAAASTAGMNLAEFGALISKSGQALGAFGTTTEDGAKNFSKVSKELRATSSELYALGYGTKEINEGLANYGKLLRMQGAQGTKSNSELAAGAKNYLKEMDMLAKVTGESRADKEREREALQKDAQLRAALAGLGPEVQSSVQTMIQSMPSQEMKDFAKDILANGTATTDSNRLLMSQMPGLAAELQRMHAQTQKGNAIQKDQMNQALNNGKTEAKANLQRIKGAVAADESVRVLGAGLGSMAEVNTDAIKSAGEQQDAAKKTTDGFNEKMEKMREVLNNVSNTFTEILASSGFLDLMIGAVKVVADIAMAVLVPALKALDAGIRPIIAIFMKVLPPVLAVVGAVFEKIGFGLQLIFQPVIEKVGKALDGVSVKFESFKGVIDKVDQALNFMFGIVDSVVKALGTAFGGLWEAVQGLMQPLQGLWSAVSDLFATTNELGGGFDWLETTILEVGQVVGEAFKILGAIIGFAVEKVTDMVKWFTEVVMKSETVSKYFTTLSEVVSSVWQTFRKYFSVDGIKSVFEDLSDGFQGMIDAIMHMLPNAMGGMSDEVYKQRQEEREARAKARDTVLETAKAEKDAKIAAQQKEVNDDKKKFADKKVYADANKKLSDKELSGREAAAKAAEKSIDYNAGPEELLKQMAKKEGSSLVPKDSKDVAKGLADAAKTAAPSNPTEAAGKTKTESSTAKAESTKKEIESASDQKKQDEAKARMDAEQRAKGDSEKSKSTDTDKQKPTQESAETLLAQLNTNMAQLIKLSQDQKDISERQLSVQKSLTGDLFASV